MWTYSWCTQIDQIHWDSSFIMTPSGPFLVTRTSRADNYYLRLQSCRPFTPQADFVLLRKRIVFITRGPLPAELADLRRLRGPLPVVSGPFSLSRIPMDIFGSFSLIVLLFSQQADLFCSIAFLTIYAMTRANRVDSLGPLKRFWSVTSASRTDFFVRADL